MNGGENEPTMEELANSDQSSLTNEHPATDIGQRHIVLDSVLCFLSNFQHKLDHLRLRTVLNEQFSIEQISGAQEKLAEFSEENDKHSVKVENHVQDGGLANSSGCNLDKLLTDFDKFSKSAENESQVFATSDLSLFLPLLVTPDWNQQELLREIQQLKQMVAELGDKEQQREGSKVYIYKSVLVFEPAALGLLNSHLARAADQL